jgi:hypothetical protein
MMMRHIAIALLATLGGGGAVLAGQALYRGHLAAQGSAVSAISGQALRALAEYHASHGRYPQGLTELRLDLAAADEADESTLRFVRYSSDGVSFTYAEIGPDQWHRRVWWCHGPSACGVADLQ